MSSLKFLTIPLVAIVLDLFVSVAARAADLDESTQKKLAQKSVELAKWAKDPVIVAAVETANAKPPYPDMNQDKWKTLGVLDPIVVRFSKSEAAAIVKKNKGKEVSEAFINSKDGCKVALLAKTTSWCHDKSDKHKLPMAGKNWQGNLEVDESSQKKQIQLAVPVKDSKGTPIGSLVVGFDVNEL